MNHRKLTLTTLILSAFISSSAFAAEEEKSGMKHDDKKGHDMNNMEMTPMADMLKGKSGDEFEAAYLSMMMMHHKDGIKMAQMGADKATNAQLKQMMQKSVKDQQEDNEKISAMLKKHKSSGDMSKPAESEKMMSMAMSELQGASGSEFDAKFARHMAMHHMDAIAMSKMAQSNAKDSDVKQLASKTVSTQTEEREKLMKMAKS